MGISVKALLKQVPTAAYLYAALGLAVIGAYNGWAYHQREIGKREVQLVAAAADLRDAKREIERLASQYRVDTVRFTSYRLRTDTMTTTVELWKRDTIRVVEYVTKADSTIRVCAAALQTCEQRVGAVTRALDASERANRILKQSFPSPAKPWLYGVAGIGVGYLARTLLK